MSRRVSLVDMSGRRRRTRRIFFWGGIVLGAGFIIIGLLWVLARSKAFMVHDVKVAGTTYLAPEEVLNFLQSHVATGGISRFLGSQNILAWPAQFSTNDLRDLPVAVSLHIRKDYFHRTITAEVTERKRMGLWCFMQADPDRCLWFDPDGILFMTGYSVEGSLTPVLHDYGRASLSIGQAVLPPRFLPNLLSIFKALQTTNLSVQEVRLNDLSLEEIEASTYGGPKLLFSLRFPAAGVSNAVDAVGHMVKIADLQYIDFRVQNKVYYK